MLQNQLQKDKNKYISYKLYKGKKKNKKITLLN